MRTVYLAWVALGFVAAGFAGVVVRSSAGASGRSVLAVESTDAGWQLVRVDALTLRRAPGGSVGLGSSFSSAWDSSPARTRLAVGTGSGVAIIDPARMRRVELLRTGSAPTWVVWLSPHRVVAVSDGVIAGFDSSSRRLVWRRDVPAIVAAFGRWRDQLVFVLDPMSSHYGTATLLTVDVSGRIRSVPLDLIHAGEPVSGSSDSRGAEPGLAVDAKDGFAYVVGGGDPVAKVDLRTLKVRYAPSRQPAQLLHGETGPTRTAAYLGGGVLAVSGFDEHLSEQNGKTSDSLMPVGLTLINTNTWTSQVINQGAGAITASGTTLLAYSAPWSIVNGSYVLRNRGNGVSGYTASGKLAYHVLAGQPVTSVQIDEGYAYVPLGADRTAVIRLRDGRRLAIAASRANPILLGAPSFSE